MMATTCSVKGELDVMMGKGVIKAGDYRALPLLRPVSIQERIMVKTKPE
jgi:hypothetical protein